jgi:hypothetical protein
MIKVTLVDASTFFRKKFIDVTFQLLKLLKLFMILMMGLLFLKIAEDTLIDVVFIGYSNTNY